MPVELAASWTRSCGMNNPIFDYQEAIESGAVTVGFWIRTFYAWLCRELLEGRLTYDSKRANRAIRFIETFCHHSKGRNDLLVLELWQKAFVATIFGVLDMHLNRQFREVLLVVGRKNGKSLLAAAIIACALVIDREYGAEIYCVAPKLTQADIIYSAFWQTVKSEPDLRALVEPKKNGYYMESTNSWLLKIAFNSKKSDGFNPHVTCCDEIASWPGDKGLKQYEVMVSATGSRRQPLTLSTTTAGYENDGIFDELMKRSTAFLLGNSRETRLAPFLYMIDDISKWDDMEELKKANPNLGVSISEQYLREQIQIAYGSLSKKAEFLTKHCNIKQNSSVAWLPANEIEALCTDALRLEDFRGCYCVGGIDLSRTTDLTACCVVIERDGKLYTFAHFFLPANKLEEATERDGLPYAAYVQKGWLTLSGENFVQYEDCFRWFKDLVEKYRIYPLQVGYDRYTAQYLVQDMQGYGFHMDDVYQGFNLTPVITEMEGLVKDKQLLIGNNSILKVHLCNAAVKLDAQTDKKRLVKIRPTDRIDGTAAVLDALTVRQKWYKEIGYQLKNAA